MYPAKWSDTFVEVSFREIESISPRKFLASNSTVFSASLLCFEFWQIDWCHIILSPGSWFSIYFEVALGRYWKEPITHLAILAQPPHHWITLQSLCQNMLIEAWNGSIYRWHGVSLWWKCLYTPFIYTLFYIIYTFGYFTHTSYTHFLPCVLIIIIIILCVSYDSIHVLNVYVLSRVIYSVFCYKQVYKVLEVSRAAQLKMNESRGPGERVFGERGGNHTTDWLRAICR